MNVLYRITERAKEIEAAKVAAVENEDFENAKHHRDSLNSILSI